MSSMMKSEEAPSTPPPSESSVAPTAKRGHLDPLLWLITAMLALVALYAWWWQSPPLNPLAPTPADRWLRPIELNPAADRPLIPSVDLHALWFFSDNEGFVAGEHGVLQRTRDGGKTWETVTLRGVENAALTDGIYTLLFSRTDPNRGYLAGRNGLWLSTTDRGANWSVFQSFAAGTAEQAPAAPAAPANVRINLNNESAAQQTQNKMAQQPERSVDRTAPPRSAPHIYQLAFTEDGQSLLAASSQGLLRHAINGASTELNYVISGELWNITTARNEVWMTGPTGYCFGEERVVLSGKAPAVRPNSALFDHVVAAGPELFLVGKDFALGRSTDLLALDARPLDGQSGISVRHNLPAPAAGSFRACALAPDYVGWAVGENGRVVRVDVNDRADRSISGFSGTLYAIWAFSGNEVVVVGEDGAMFRTTNAGATWSPLTANCWPAPTRTNRRNWRIPALWFYPLFGLLAWVGYQRWRSRPARQVMNDANDAIASELATDRALTEAADDRLGFNRHVQGLSRYLRNTATQPPVTLAIAGAWGTGKTSFMNLLRADLQKYGLSTVWFNAWHHQQEPQILAPLLQAIRSDGAPSFFSARADIALRFRWRLLCRRLSEQRVLLFAVVVLLCLGLGVRQRLHGESPLTALAEGVTMLGDEKSIEHGIAQVIGGGSFVGLIVGLGLLAWRVAVLFGVNPASLLATESGKTSQLALSEQTSFRQEFASKFRDVADALKPYPLVVFIDDLDRCHAAKVFQILEAINYLVSSGDCFVVLGMDEERVRDSVAQYFVGLPSEAPKIDVPASPAAEVRTGRTEAATTRGWTDARTLAQNYLEKLVQLRVDVPTPSLEAIRRLAVPQKDAGPAVSEAARRERWTAIRMVAFWSLVVLTACGLAFFGGRALAPMLAPDRAPKPEIVDRPANLPASPVKSDRTEQTGRGEKDAPEVAAAPLFRERTTLNVDSRDSHRSGAAPIAAIVSVCAALAAAWLAQRELRSREILIVRDSAEFAAATGNWSEFLRTRMGERFTPRALKRFKNRVRYYSMALRDEAESADSALNDSVIVTLGALEQLKITPQMLAESAVEYDLNLPPNFDAQVLVAKQALQRSRDREVYEAAAASADVRA